MNRNEVKLELDKFYQSATPGQTKGASNYFKSKFPEVYNYIHSEMNRLNLNDFAAIVYLIRNELTEIPKCPDCGSNVKYGYDKYKQKRFLDRCPKCAMKHAGSVQGSKARTKESLDKFAATIANRKSNQLSIIEQERNEKLKLVNHEYVHNIIKTLVSKNKSEGKENLGGVVVSLKSDIKYPGVFKFIESEMKTMHCRSVTEYLYLIVHDMTSIPICPTCKINQCSFINSDKGYQSGCTICNIERSRLVQQNVQNKYGVDNSMQLESARQKISDLWKNQDRVEKRQAKLIATNLERYGVKYTFSNEEVRAKGKQTSIERYGVDHHMKTDEYRQQFHDRIAATEDYQNNLEFIKSELEKHGYTLMGEYKNAVSRLTIRCHRCGRIFETTCWMSMHNDHNHIETLCKHCYPASSAGHSLEEDRLVRYLEERIPNLKVLNGGFGSRSIISSKRELDIYLEDHKTAIEYNGLYVHNSTHIGNRVNNRNKPLDKFYHFTKYTECLEKGIRLITVFDKRKSDNWMDMIYKSIIGQYDIPIEELPNYTENGTKYYVLDNCWTSYQFYKFKDRFDLIKQMPPRCWLYDDKYHCSFISYDEFKKSYCTETENVFEVAKDTEFNQWYYDCGYQVLKLK